MPHPCIKGEVQAYSILSNKAQTKNFDLMLFKQAGENIDPPEMVAPDLT